MLFWLWPFLLHGKIHESSSLSENKTIFFNLVSTVRNRKVIPCPYIKQPSWNPSSGRRVYLPQCVLEGLPIGSQTTPGRRLQLHRRTRCILEDISDGGLRHRKGWISMCFSFVATRVGFFFSLIQTIFFYNKKNHCLLIVILYSTMVQQHIVSTLIAIIISETKYRNFKSSSAITTTPIRLLYVKGTFWCRIEQSNHGKLRK